MRERVVPELRGGSPSESLGRVWGKDVRGAWISVEGIFPGAVSGEDVNDIPGVMGGESGR